MHPYASLVLQNYYKAIGWNEDNLYSNLTRASTGKHLVYLSGCLSTLRYLNSNSGLSGAPRCPLPYIKVTEQFIQHNLFYERSSES